MKKLLALLFALTMVLALAACGGAAEEPAEAEDTETAEAAETEETAEETGDTVTLRVGASPTPHAEILAQVVDDLATRLATTRRRRRPRCATRGFSRRGPWRRPLAPSPR